VVGWMVGVEASAAAATAGAGCGRMMPGRMGTRPGGTHSRGRLGVGGGGRRGS
jgi:hypothetical protein